MVVGLRYVNKEGIIIERILGIIHVPGTTSQVLKNAIDSLFAIHGLSTSRIRGQGYDGASNMSGSMGGLKNLILQENKCTYHCFAHQLQLKLVVVAKKHEKLCSFFDYLSSLANFMGASCKIKELLLVKQIEKIDERISQGSLDTGREVLEDMKSLPSFSMHKGVISRLIEVISEYEFVFLLFTMKKVLGITNELSQSLQRKYQDLSNAINLVNVAKLRLQEVRENGWNNLFVDISQFCEMNEVNIPQMDNFFVPRGRSCRNTERHTNLHHFQVDLFSNVIDFQLQEMNDRFDNVNLELLTCISSLDPRDSFSTFDKQKLIQLSKLYPMEFDDISVLALDDQLENYIMDMRNDNDFIDLKGVSDSAQKMVQKQKDLGFPLVYMLIKLALILPVATKTVERVFSAMNLIKHAFQN